MESYAEGMFLLLVFNDGIGWVVECGCLGLSSNVMDSLRVLVG